MILLICFALTSISHIGNVFLNIVYCNRNDDFCYVLVYNL